MIEGAQRALLVELTDSLARLPPPPRHREMRQRIKTLLTEPVVLGQLHPYGRKPMPAGVPRLEGTVLTVGADQEHDSAHDAERRLRPLQSGIVTELPPA